MYSSYVRQRKKLSSGHRRIYLRATQRKIIWQKICCCILVFHGSHVLINKNLDLYQIHKSWLDFECYCVFMWGNPWGSNGGDWGGHKTFSFLWYKRTFQVLQITFSLVWRIFQLSKEPVCPMKMFHECYRFFMEPLFLRVYNKIEWWPQLSSKIFMSRFSKNYDFQSFTKNIIWLWRT